MTTLQDVTQDLIAFGKDVEWGSICMIAYKQSHEREDWSIQDPSACHSHMQSIGGVREFVTSLWHHWDDPLVEAAE